MLRFSKILIYTICCTLLFGATAYAAPKIVFNGKTVKSDVAPLVEKGVTLVPLRVILETFGAKVNYDKSSRKISVEQGNLMILLKINDTNAYVGNAKTTLLIAPKLVNNRTVVPLRFLSEAMSADVLWDAKTQTVSIKYMTSAMLESQRLQDEKTIFKLVNATRKEFGLREFIWVDELATLARSHSEDMATNHFLDHVSPYTGSPIDRAHNVGLTSVGENIAAGPFTPQSVHDAWMNSAGHRSKTLNPDFRFMSVGAYTSSDKNDEYGGKYFTQNFIAGDTFFTSPFDNSTVTSSSITISGYSVSTSPKIKVYKMVGGNQYSETYEVALNVVNNKFSQKVELKHGSGVYELWASKFDVRKVTLK